MPFPIAFPKAIFSIAACSNYTTFYIDDVKIPTLTGFYTGIGSDQGDGLVWWFAIGKQQWGYYKATSGSYTVTFPIAFSRQTCAVCVTNVNSGAGYPVTYTPNTSSIKITNKCYENFWIAVGFQQWGVIPANVGVVTWIYPIKFTSVYSLVTTRYAAYFDSLTQYSDKEMALCYINVDKCRINRGNDATERIYVIAIGQAQQWGKIAIGHDETVTVTLPIAVKPINVQIAVADGSNTSSTYRSLNWKSASFQISVYAWPTNYFWFAICWQQWGLTKTASEVVTYPIAVSQVYCLLLTTKATTFRYSPWPTKITTKSFQAYSDCEQAYWLLVAKQQWGNSDETNRDATVTFPIAFSVLYSVVGVPKSSSNLSGSNSNFGVKSQNNKSFIANMYDNSRGYAGFNWCVFGKAQALPIYRQQYS